MRLLLSFALAATLVLPALPASADAVDSAVNESRSTWLPIRAEAEGVANASASRQAANGAISHTSLQSLTSVCSSAGEIVGSGPSIRAIFDLFLQSPTHRQLLLSPTWTAMGTGVVTGANGTLYVSVVFCTELSPAAAPAPAPPPPPPTSPPAAQPPAPRPASATGTVAPQPVVPPAPVVSFQDVFFRLVTGELDDLWVVLTASAPPGPLIGPTLFLPLSDWSTITLPALS